MRQDRRRDRRTASAKVVMAAGLGLIVSCTLLSTPLGSTMTASTMNGTASKGLTDVPGLKVGHFTLQERPTGCTVVLAEQGAVAGVDVRGAAPGTRETDLLNPINTVSEVHAIVLSGGSAFGLDAASGVVRYLEERKIGFKMSTGVVPIVPAAVLFDLGVGDPKIRPTADCGYKAAAAANDGPVARGDVGAGAGATVGKLAGGGRAMKGGIGSATFTLPDGLIVSALIAVNAVGDVIDPATGRVVAGVRSEDGRSLADARILIRNGLPPRARSGENTTIGIVATNAKLTKIQATRMAQIAHDGLARAIYPVHTPFDGDTLFAMGTGHWTGEPNLLTLGTLAADATAAAILDAVRNSQGLPNLPAVRTLDASARP